MLQDPDPGATFLTIDAAFPLRSHFRGAGRLMSVTTTAPPIDPRNPMRLLSLSLSLSLLAVSSVSADPFCWRHSLPGRDLVRFLEEPHPLHDTFSPSAGESHGLSVTAGVRLSGDLLALHKRPTKRSKFDHILEIEESVRFAGGVAATITRQVVLAPPFTLVEQPVGHGPRTDRFVVAGANLTWDGRSTTGGGGSVLAPGTYRTGIRCRYLRIRHGHGRHGDSSREVDETPVVEGSVTIEAPAPGPDPVLGGKNRRIVFRADPIDQPDPFAPPVQTSQLHVELTVAVVGHAFMDSHPVRDTEPVCFPIRAGCHGTDARPVPRGLSR